ncbi:MAG TPA: hypothetical protein VN739_06275 [Nitrososphaerales archaeon]|nr:hypothetical protein [Nitrososphaerales archaeon]
MLAVFCVDIAAKVALSLEVSAFYFGTRSAGAKGAETQPTKPSLKITPSGEIDLDTSKATTQKITVETTPQNEKVNTKIAGDPTGSLKPNPNKPNEFVYIPSTNFKGLAVLTFTLDKYSDTSTNLVINVK